jgi:hypothetical protein
MKIQYPIILVATSLLMGCGTTEVIRNAHTNSYSVSAQYGSINGSWTRASKEAGEKAIDYCKSMGKKFVFINEQRTGVVGWSPQESIINFDCTDATAPVDLKKLLVD